MTKTEIYAAALREAGFDERAVAAGLRLLESRDVHNDFAMTVSILQLHGHTAAVREDQLDQIRRAVELAEVRAEVIARGERAALATAAANADREARRRDRDRLRHQANEAMAWVLANMSDDELQGRTPLRPHVDEGWRRYLALRAEEQRLDEGRVSPDIDEQLRALDVGSRLSGTLSAGEAPSNGASVVEAGNGQVTGL